MYSTSFDVGLTAYLAELSYEAQAELTGFGEAITLNNIHAYRIRRPGPKDLVELANFEKRSGASSEITGLVMTVEVRPRGNVTGRGMDETAPLDRFIAEAYREFLTSFDPSHGAGIAKVSTTIPGGSQSRDVASKRSAATLYGNKNGPAHILLYTKVKGSDPSVRNEDCCLGVDLVLSKDGCAANGLKTVSDLLSSNTRQIFGSYINLRSRQGGARMGELNARVRRQIERAIRDTRFRVPKIDSIDQNHGELP